jgi:hypothetical protein
VSSPAENRTTEILERLAVFGIQAEGSVSGDWTHLRLSPAQADRLLRLLSLSNDEDLWMAP